MRVALISTDNEFSAFGIRIISSVLKERGHRTRLLLLPSQGLYPREVLRGVRQLVNDADVIGVSCLSRGSNRARQLIEDLRPLGRTIVWGGLHATLNPEECANVATVVCRGEGEGMMLELLERLERGRDDFDGLENAVFRRNGTVVGNPLRPLVNDLDSLPNFDFSCDDEHRLTPAGLCRISDQGGFATGPEIPFSGSRGCAFNCTYCCNSALKRLYAGNGRFVRKVGISRYVEHCAELVRHFPRTQFKYFYLFDEDFLSRSVEDLREFAERFPREVGLPIQCMASPAHVTEEKIELLSKAGLWRLSMGIESGSERTKREVFKRAVSNDQVLRAAGVLTRFPQVTPCYYLIVGNPYETERDVRATVRLLADLPPGYQVRIYNLVFFPGSLLYERAVEDGIITGKEESAFDVNFLGGFRGDEATWKRRNLYLNALLFFMEGTSGRWRIGLVPRRLVPFLLRRRMVKLGDTFSRVVMALCRLKVSLMAWRERIGRLFKRIGVDPRGLRRFRMLAGKQPIRP